MILHVEELSFAYRSKEVISKIDFTVNAGEIIALLGRNGAGKSTLLKSINRLLRPQEGRVLIDGSDTRSMTPAQVARKIGWVPQHTEASKLTVFDFVLLGRKPHFTWGPRKEDITTVEEVLSRVGIEDLALRSCDQLSGGEFQQVQIARALAQEPAVILFDEPTSSLDLSNQYHLMKMVRSIASDGRTAAVMALHDINLALRYADRFLLLKDGKLFAAGGREVITEVAIKAVYGIEATIIEVAGSPTIVPKS